MIERYAQERTEELEQLCLSARRLLDPDNPSRIWIEQDWARHQEIMADPQRRSAYLWGGWCGDHLWRAFLAVYAAGLRVIPALRYLWTGNLSK